jgi:anthranilate phosphoribosyltransferase
VRKKLGIRTIFNLLGPLCNPAKVKRQLLGVYAREWIESLAQVLADLGTEKAWVVHGSDGLDELTLTGVTCAAVLQNNAITAREITPEDAGLSRSSLAALKGGEAGENAAALTALLNGEPGAYRDIVLLNAAAALLIADRVRTLKDGVGLVADSIDSGRALQTLEKLAACSHAVAA